MPTKNDLIVQIETMKLEHAEEVALLNHQMEVFRKKVVRVARANAKVHDWCAVVDDILVKKMDLADLLPDSWVVQRQVRSGRWTLMEKFDSRLDGVAQFDGWYKDRAASRGETYRLVRVKASGEVVKVLDEVTP